MTFDLVQLHSWHTQKGTVHHKKPGHDMTRTLNSGT